MITFPVRTGAAYTRNALFTGVSDTRLKQTESEHRQLLDIRTMPEYRTVLALPPQARPAAIARLRELAKLRERQYPKYWNDRRPRADRRGIRPLSSSSFLGDIGYQSGVATVRIGQRTYGYPMSQMRLKQFLESPSLGIFYNRYMSRRHG